MEIGLSPEQKSLINAICIIIGDWVDIEDIYRPNTYLEIIKEVDELGLSENESENIKFCLWNLFKIVRDHSIIERIKNHEGKAAFPDIETSKYDTYDQV